MKRKWRFYLEDMIKFAGKVLTYIDDLDQAGLVANGLTYDATLRNLKLLGERLKLISQARATTLMTSFTKGDRVGFQAPDGRTLEGIVLRLVQSAGDVQWP